MLMWGLMPLCAVVLIVMWFIFGNDKKTIPMITVSPPQNLDPLEMDYAQIATISDRGIYAMLLYWVSKGYLETKDDEEEKRVAVCKITDLPEDAPEHAKYLFNAVFHDADLVWLDQMPESITEHKIDLCNLVAKRFEGENAVLEDSSMYPTMTAIFLMIAAIFVVSVMADIHPFLAFFLVAVLFCALALLQNGALGFMSKHDRFEVLAGGITTLILLIVFMFLLWLNTGSALFAAIFGICYLICVPCIMFMERRTNHKLYGQILGFRMFIETAEWERLKMMSEEDPAFGMDILPYAMLFNMGTEWTKKFEYNTIYNTVETMEEMSKETAKEETTKKSKSKESTAKTEKAGELKKAEKSKKPAKKKTSNKERQ